MDSSRPMIHLWVCHGMTQSHDNLCQEWDTICILSCLMTESHDILYCHARQPQARLKPSRARDFRARQFEFEFVLKELVTPGSNLPQLIDGLLLLTLVVIVLK